MHSKHDEVLLKYISCLLFLKSRNIYVSTKLTLGVMGLKITTPSQEPANCVPIVKLKIFYKIS